MLFIELPFLDRFEAAKRAGFQGVEFLFPYSFDAHDIRRALDSCGLPLILFNTPAGNWQAEERGFAAVPDGQVRFQRDLALALEYAAVLEPRHLHIMSGIAAGSDSEKMLIKNLQVAAMVAPDQSFLVEPLNPQDVPGYFLDGFPKARRVIEAVNQHNLGLQFDAYHSQMIGQDVMSDWLKFSDLARHIQVAGAPGRHEPTPSAIDYARFFARVDADGYGGFISAEYHPRRGTIDGLDWLWIARA